MILKYELIPDYSMKCKITLSNTQKKQVDDILYGKVAAKNMILHNLYEGKYCVPAKDDPKALFPDFNLAVKKEVLDELREENKYVKLVPGAGLSSTKNGVIADIKRAWEATGKHPINQWNWHKNNKEDGIIQNFGPQYHSKYDSHASVAFGTGISKNNFKIIKNKKTGKDTDKIVFSIKNVDGDMKINGWNKTLRFDESHNMNFIDYLKSDFCKTMISIRILRDLDVYYIIISLKNVYRPYKELDNKNEHIGVDIGETTLAAFSNGEKYPNIFDAFPEYQKILDSIDYLESKQSKLYGYKNIQFRQQRKKDRSIKPSNNYLRLQKRIRRLRKRRKDIQETYYNQLTAKMMQENAKINTEPLDIAGMFWYKDKETEGEKSNEKKKTRKNKKTNRKA